MPKLRAMPLAWSACASLFVFGAARMALALAEILTASAQVEPTMQAALLAAGMSRLLSIGFLSAELTLPIAAVALAAGLRAGLTAATPPTPAKGQP
jgi:hypothetical protein